MAHVSGPTSSMPGSLHPPEGAACDNHPDRPAAVRRQGETDSMGAEFADLCQECYDAERAAEKEAGPLTGRCDRCKAEDQALFARRDYDEGMCGPVYQVCRPCITKENEAADEEMSLAELYDNW